MTALPQGRQDEDEDSDEEIEVLPPVQPRFDQFMMGHVELPAEIYLPEKAVSVMQNRVNGIEDGA